MRSSLRRVLDRLPPVASLLVAAVAGAAGVAGSYAVAGFTPSLVVGPIAGALARRLPGAVITAAILVLGDVGELLNVVTAAALATGLFAAAALAALAITRRTDAPRPVAAGIAAVLVAAAAAAVTRAPAASVAAGAATGGVLVVAALASGARSSASAPAPENADGDGVEGGSSPDPDADVTPATDRNGPARRGVLGAVASGLGIAAVGSVLGARGGLAGRGSVSGGDAGDGVTLDVPESTAGEIESLLGEARARSLGIEGIEPLVSEEFYEVDINATDPEIDPDDWSLTVTGAVEEAVTVGYDEIRAMEPENRFASLRCVGEQLNGEKLDTALWTGVPITALLPTDLPDECCVMLRAADDYYEEFPLAALSDGFLAYGMNGDPLPRGHGHPVRALIPGHWGEINVKWLTEIEVLEEEAVGYWEERGWHGTGPVETVAKLHAVTERDDRVVVGGHAYAGTRGIDRVEVSTDGGGSWTDATRSEPLPGDDVWRQWRYAYDHPGAPHDVVVRAVDGTGELQPEAESPPFPDGPTGWVSRTVGE